MELVFHGELVYWRGPSPWHFVEVPEDECATLAAGSRHSSYGWGCIPVTARIGRTTFTTSLFPREGAYMVPVKTSVRATERLELGDDVSVSLVVAPRT